MSIYKNRHFFMFSVELYRNLLIKFIFMKKILIIIISIFILSSCFWNKTTIENNSNIDIDSSSLVEEVIVLEPFLKDIREIEFYELNNSLYQKNWGDKLKEKIDLLLKDVNIENKQKASFLQSFVGDYENSLQNRENFCLEDNNLDYCKKIDFELISYFPRSTTWEYLEWVKMYFDNRELWEFKWVKKVQLEDKFVHRIKLEKEWYLDFFEKIVIDGNIQDSISINPIMIPANKNEIIDPTKMNTIYSDNFTYVIEEDSFIDKSWNLYSKEVIVYLFDLWSNEQGENVFNLDVFTEDLDYNWYSFNTYWMPMLIAYDKSWNRLKFQKEVKWKWIIENLNNIFEIDIRWVPKNTYLWKEELDNYNIPPFWYLNLNSGIWNEWKMSILDENWNYEFIYPFS